MDIGRNAFLNRDDFLEFPEPTKIFVQIWTNLIADRLSRISVLSKFNGSGQACAKSVPKVILVMAVEVVSTELLTNLDTVKKYIEDLCVA